MKMRNKKLAGDFICVGKSMFACCFSLCKTVKRTMTFLSPPVIESYWRSSVVRSSNEHFNDDGLFLHSSNDFFRANEKFRMPTKSPKSCLDLQVGTIEWISTSNWMNTHFNMNRAQLQNEKWLIKCSIQENATSVSSSIFMCMLSVHHETEPNIPTQQRIVHGIVNGIREEQNRTQNQEHRINHMLNVPCSRAMIMTLMGFALTRRAL